MRIAAVSKSIPSKKVSNFDIIDRLDALNPETDPALKSNYLQAVDKLLAYSGARNRYIRDQEAGETAREHIINAMKAALDEADLAPESIDLLIYCGVGRGFLEPANAYFFAAACKMTNASCFDVTDACMSWVRALNIAHDMQKQGSHRHIMAINGEFHVGIHDNWQIQSMDALNFSFPMYTIGEAATATILSPSRQKWRFTYRSRSELADLCTIPLPGHESYAPDTMRIGLNGPMKFVSWGKQLLAEGNQNLSALIETIPDISETTDLFFPHAPSERIYRDACKKMGLPPEKIYLSVYGTYGNVVSASIPVGLSCARQEGRLKRGDRITLVPASAGLVASVVQTTF
nr:3-oxoacyl-[acyl-carrier-protein] synthase III C-terminal domain-containing protein [uncultured Cohaesibacter sp.]